MMATLTSYFHLTLMPNLRSWFGGQIRELMGERTDNSSSRAAKSGRSRRVRRKAVLQSLETRRNLAAYIINTIYDVVAEDGFVSLRKAVLASNRIPFVKPDVGPGQDGSAGRD